MRPILPALRSLLTCALALAALYMASFPDSLLSEEFAAVVPGGRTAQHLHDWLWVLPVVLMEVVSGMGGRRNAVWFSGLLSAWGLAALALPLLRWHAPEWVMKTHEAEDIKLYAGFFGMSLFIGASLFFRLAVLRYLFPPAAGADEEKYAYSGETLKLVPARTVQEITSAPPRRRRHFLFGEVDEERIRKWGLAGRAALVFVRTRARLTAAVCAAILVWNAAFYYGTGGAEGERARDFLRIRECRYEAAGGRFAATDRAVHAAYRLFREADESGVFNGKTTREMEVWFALDQWNPAYLKQAMTPPEDAENDVFSLKECWLTIDDGTKRATLSLYRNQETDRINVVELGERGWDPRRDARRGALGADWGVNVHTN